MVAVFPLHMPEAVPIHHVGLRTPVALKETIPPGKFCASADAGLTTTLFCPHPAVNITPAIAITTIVNRPIEAPPTTT
jgi:hypothetical protein